MKVKVNRVRGGSMGDQRNYGLVTGSIWNYEDKPSSNQVGDTMSAVPRDEATIEAERGETIVGDLDNDGMLEHVIVGGKRHFQGGTPLNVPDGSFVYSDTRALRIKNKDVLKGIFNMSASSGVTPAKVAKRYDLNQYKDLLMDPESDFLTKKTAQMMIDNNVKKLGQLALIQEGMKGFPDGIPNIALPLFANDIAVSQPSEQPQQMMRKGGLIKYQGTKSQVGAPRLTNEQITQKVMLDAYRKKLKEEQRGLERKVKKDPNLATHYKTVQEAAHKAYEKWSNAPSGTIESREALRNYERILKELQNVAASDAVVSRYPEFEESRGIIRSGENIKEGPYVFYKYAPIASKKEMIIPDPTQLAGVRFATGPTDYEVQTDPIGPKMSSAQQLATHNLVQRKAAQKAAEKMSRPGTGSSYSMQQDAGVKKANELYTKALISGNPEDMRKAAAEIDKIDIPGITTGIGAISEGLRGIAGLEATLMGDIYGFGPNEGYDFSSTKPFGLTWQEKINDMRDILNRKVRELESTKASSAYREKTKSEKTDFKKKYDAITKEVNTILANPSLYSPDKIQKALDIYQQIEDPRFLGIPSPSYAGLGNPYQKTISSKSIAPIYTPLSTNINEAYESLFGKPAVAIPGTTGRTPTRATIAADANAVNAVQSTPAVRDSAAAPAATQGNIIEVDPTSNTVTTSSGTRSVPAMTDAQIRDMIAADQGVPPDSITQEEINAYRRPYAAGGSLPKHQSTGPVLYNVKDKPVIEGARKQRKRATYPYPWYNPNLASIGPQTTASGDYVVLPSGVISRKGATNPIDIQQVIAARPPGSIDWTTYPGGGGKDQFIKDIAAAKGAVSPASTWFVDEVLNPYSVQHSGYPAIDVTKPGAYNPGYEWATTAIFEDIPAQVVPAAGGQDQEPVAETTMKDIPATQYSSGMYDSPWSNYSLVDLGAALSNYYNIDRGPLPLKQRFTPYLPDATYMDPARAIAQAQGVTRGSQEAIMSASEPTVGRANVIAAQATSAPQVADIMAKYDQANVGIANQIGSATAQIMNEAELRNLGLDKQYVDELTTLEQQYQNALAEGRTEVAESIKRGMADAMYRAGINLENPNYAIDPLTGRYYFKPGFNPATGTNIFASATRTGTGAVAAIQEIMQQLGISAAEAAQVYRASMGAGRNAVSNPADIMWNPNVVQ